MDDNNMEQEVDAQVSQQVIQDNSQASNENDYSRPEYLDFDAHDFPGGVQACIEAILMATDSPKTVEDFARVLVVPAHEVEEALAHLEARYNHDDEQNAFGFEIRKTNRGWQFASKAAFEPIVSAFLKDKQSSRLSQAALEALAIIAYKQPMTRADVAAIRGVNSDGVIRSLFVRGLIKEDGVDEQTHASMLVTTDVFLENMGFESIQELPSLAPFLPQTYTQTEQEEE